MKLAKTFLIGLSLALVSPAAASDFSKIAEPGFARSLLLSPERNKEMNCAALAYLPYRKTEVIDVMVEEPVDEPTPVADVPVTIVIDPVTEPVPEIVFEKLLTEAEAEKLRAAIFLRLQSDIGDEEWATGALEHRYAMLAPDWDFSVETIARKSGNREALKPGCQPIFDATASDTLDTILSPPSAEPIALPDLNTCLAYDLIARSSAKYADYNILHERHGDSLYDRIVGPKGPKRRAREKEIVAHAATLDKIAPDLAAVRMMTCLPTFSFALRK